MDWREAMIHVAHGGMLAYPTDTLWGLGCMADDPDRVRSCLALKGTGRQPVASVIVDPGLLGDFVHLPSDASWKRFLPGPYTLVLPLKQEHLNHLSGDGGSLGVRIPDHPQLMDMVRQLGQPLLTTSLNSHDQPPAPTLRQARRTATQMGIPCVDEAFDGIGPSTVVRWSARGEWICLRQGVGRFP